MSAIDNAFIRAYTLDTAAASPRAASDYDAPTAVDSKAAPVAKPQGLLIKTSPAAARSSRRAPGSTNATAAGPIASERPANTLTSPRRTLMPAVAKTPAAAMVSPVVPAPHIRLTSFIHTTTTLEPSATAQSVVILEPPTLALPTSELELPADEPLADEAAPIIESTKTTTARKEAVALEVAAPEVAPVEVVPPAVAATLPFSAEIAAKSELETEGPRAAFEVDQFVWPDLCDSLLEKRAGEFDQLVGQLVTESALGRKVVVITGSRRGDGRTTLALLLARRLAATAVKVVVVDADFEVPQLATRLGMAVQSGWENVLTDGLPVWEGLVESMGDRVALLPLAPRPASSIGKPTAAEFVAQHTDAIRQHLETLRKHFDVVLVDAGAIKAVRPDAKPRGPLALAGGLDAAIVVSDARTTAPGRIAELHRRLQEAGIVPLGIAENFCPSKQD